MKINDLTIGMKIRHPMYGNGEVVAIRQQAADIEFDGVLKTVSPDSSGVEPAEPQLNVQGLNQSLGLLIQKVVEETIENLGLQNSNSPIEGLASKWEGGNIILQPQNSSSQSKNISIDTFFHKITMVRNNLRVLEQKINSHKGLSEGEKFELQQYISKSYGSLTTFNILFKNKDEQFSSK